MNIQINTISINENRRALNISKVRELAESIKNIGLINPITIKVDGLNRYTLIAGLHRLEAYRLLNKSEIESIIFNTSKKESELIEIDENLIRNEIHFIDRGDYFNRRDEILDSC